MPEKWTPLTSPIFFYFYFFFCYSNFKQYVILTGRHSGGHIVLGHLNTNNRRIVTSAVAYTFLTHPVYSVFKVKRFQVKNILLTFLSVRITLCKIISPTKLIMMAVAGGFIGGGECMCIHIFILCPIDLFHSEYFYANCASNEHMNIHQHPPPPNYKFLAMALLIVNGSINLSYH